MKVKVQKTGSNLNSNSEDFDLKSLKILGPANKEAMKKKDSGDMFDEAVAIVIKEVE